jgi:hypothetical protein
VDSFGAVGCQLRAVSDWAHAICPVATEIPRLAGESASLRDDASIRIPLANAYLRDPANSFFDPVEAPVRTPRTSSSFMMM